MKKQTTGSPIVWNWSGARISTSETQLSEMVHRAFSGPFRRVLEVGCGPGEYLCHLEHWGFEADGCDPCPSAAGLRRDGRHLGPLPHLYDGYLSLGVWEHDEAGPKEFAVQAWRALRTGGRLVVSVPLLNWRVLLQSSRPGYFYQYAFGRREFVHFIEDAGFFVDWTSTYGEGYTVKNVVSPGARRRLRWLRHLPGVSRAVGHMLFVVATK